MTPVRPSEISKPVLAISKVEPTMAAQTPGSPRTSQRKSPARKATAKKPAQIQLSIARVSYTRAREPLEADPPRPRGRRRDRPLLRREGGLPGDRRPRLRPGPPGDGPALRGRLPDRRVRRHAPRGRAPHGQPRRPPARRALGALAGPRLPAAPGAPRRQGRRLLLLRRARARARHRLARPLHPGQPLPRPREQRRPGRGRLRRSRRRGPHGPAPQAGAPRAARCLQRGHGARGEPARPDSPRSASSRSPGIRPAPCSSRSSGGCRGSCSPTPSSPAC